MFDIGDAIDEYSVIFSAALTGCTNFGKGCSAITASVLITIVVIGVLNAGGLGVRLSLFSLFSLSRISVIR